VNTVASSLEIKNLVVEIQSMPALRGFSSVVSKGAISRRQENSSIAHGPDPNIIDEMVGKSSCAKQWRGCGTRPGSFAGAVAILLEHCVGKSSSAV
jgi:hypothetical protein